MEIADSINASLKLHLMKKHIFFSFLSLLLLPISGYTQYDIFISSRNTGTVKRYDAQTGKYKGEFGKEQIINETQEVAIGPDGMLYVTSLRNKQILKFDPKDGRFLGYFSSGYDLEKPTKLTFSKDGFVYVSQWGEKQSSVVRFDAKTGQFDKEVTSNLKGPLGHTWDAKGNLYVACFYSKDIHKFDKKGKALGVISPPDILKGPANLWFDKKKSLLVADWELGKIFRFKNKKLVFDSVFADGFTKLEGITKGPDGYLYGCDWWENKVLKLDVETGEDRGVFLEDGEMLRPNGIVFWKVK